MDVGDWLRSLGLERYEQAFRDNEIDLDLLPNLIADDLKDLGVALVGHRRRMLDAISALQSEAATGQPAAVRAAHEGSGPVPAGVRSDAERRHLTVLFGDLVGSTALSARLDPEEMSAIIRAYQNTVAGEITRFEGHIAKYMGDGVLAYFGWPMAHEDDAERAARAGLAITAAIGQLSNPTGEALAARVGIATGLVVVGELIGAGGSEEQAVVGETPNLAARLQALAEPGRVVIAASTRRLLGGLFELANLGAHDLKGFGAPVAAFAVEGERTNQSRFEARSGPAPLAMVGRDQELGLLLERWALAKAGEGQGVLLVGEAGIGKSRISRALLDALAEEPHFRGRYQCSPYHADSALWPVIQQLSHAANLSADDPLEARLDKLETLLDRAGGREGAPLIADLIGLDGTRRYGALDLEPQRQRERTLAVLAEQMLGLAIRQPVLVVLEDAHWIDPTTLELIERCLDRIADARVLLLLTSRPDHQPGLAAHPHVTRLTLNRLGRAGVEAIVARLGGDHLPTGTIDAIIARADGVPLFVEELTKAVLETGEASIPASLHDSLMARLDRIPGVKEVAQIAACIGREFSYALLAAVAEQPETGLEWALERLTAGELVFRRGAPPEASYTFKHALVQDAAYESLLKSRRRDLHARIASVLEERFPEVLEMEPEVLARHCQIGGLTEQAINYWQRAGQLAAERSANAEAAAHLGRSLELLEAYPETVERHETELDLLTALGSVLISTKGHGSDEVATVYTRALNLCRSLGETLHLAPVLQGVRLSHMLRAEIRPARQAAEELLTLAEQAQDAGQLLEGYRAVGILHYFDGEFRTAVEHLEKGIAIYETGQHRAHALRYALDPGQSCLSYAAKTLWMLGYPDQALRRSDRAVTVAQATSHAATIIMAITFRAEVAALRRELQDARERAATALALATEHRLPMWVGGATVIHGGALSGLGQDADSVSLIREGLTVLETTGDRLNRSNHVARLAEALGRVGRPDEGLAVLEEAMETSRSLELSYWDSAFYRLKGDLVLARDGSDGAAAEACFLRAIEIAQGQEAKSLELRAATSLARLWAGRGKRQQAIDLLAPIYGWFTEGFDTPDLEDARALLDELV